MVELIRS